MPAEHLEILKQGVHVWNAWRSKNPRVKVNLSRADLSGRDLSGVDMGLAGQIWINLEKVDLSGAKLVNADLSKAKLGGANLSKANLSGANLSRAKLSEANLNDSIFVDADMSGATLGRASAIKADFAGVNLHQARLHGVNFHSAKLQSADFSGATVLQTIFADTDLSEVHGLHACIHAGPSVIDYSTLARSATLPEVFLRGCGVPEAIIQYLPSMFNQAIEFYSCFISYSHTDKTFARRLHDQLQGKGIRCWLDEHEMLPGDDIYEQVDQGIRVYDKVLLCCSESSLTSWWVDNEIDTAFDKERKLMKVRNGKVLSLIPLNLDGYVLSDQWGSGKARQIRSRLAADFTGWAHNNDNFERAFEALIKALATDNRGRKPAPPPKL